MFTGHQTGEKRMSIPGLEGVWFGTGKQDGSVLLRRHGKVSRKDAITDIIIKKNEPVPGNHPHTILVHVLGNNEALVFNHLSEVAQLAKDGRLALVKAKRTIKQSVQAPARAPRGWDCVVA